MASDKKLRGLLRTSGFRKLVLGSGSLEVIPERRVLSSRPITSSSNDLGLGAFLVGGLLGGLGDTAPGLCRFTSLKNPSGLWGGSWVLSWLSIISRAACPAGLAASRGLVLWALVSFVVGGSCDEGFDLIPGYLPDLGAWV